jgi:hypothetical protein
LHDKACPIGKVAFAKISCRRRRGLALAGPSATSTTPRSARGAAGGIYSPSLYCDAPSLALNKENAMSELSPRFIVPRSPIASIGRAGGRCRTFRTRSGFQRAGLFLHRTVARTIRVSGEPPAFDGFDSLPSKVLTRLCLVCPLADEGRKLSSAPFRCRVPCARDPTWQLNNIVMPKWRFEDQPTIRNGKRPLSEWPPHR